MVTCEVRESWEEKSTLSIEYIPESRLGSSPPSKSFFGEEQECDIFLCWGDDVFFVVELILKVVCSTE